MAFFLPALALAAGPIAKKVLLSLGIGVVTYAALTVVATQIKDAVISNYGGLTGTTLDLLNLIGTGQAIGIVLGGIVARAAFAAVGRLGLLT